MARGKTQFIGNQATQPASWECQNYGPSLIWPQKLLTPFMKNWEINTENALEYVGFISYLQAYKLQFEKETNKLPGHQDQ